MNAPVYYQHGRFAGPREGPAWRAHLAIHDLLGSQDEEDALEATWDLRRVAKAFPDETRAVVEQYPLDMVRRGADKARGILRQEVDIATGVIPAAAPAQSKSMLYSFPLDEGRLSIDFARKPAPRRYVVPGFIPAGITAILAGHGGSGKSLVGLYAALAVALCRPFFNYPVAGAPGAVLVALGEEDEAEAHRRLYGIAEQLQFSADDLKALRERVLLYPCLGKDVRLTGHKNGVLQSTELSALIGERMNAHAERCGLSPALVVLDHFMLFSGGEINANEDAAAFARETGAIVAATGATVLTLAHSPKGDDSRKLDQHSVLGAVSTSNLARLVLLLQRMTEAEAREFNVPKGERWRWLNLWTGKTNYTKAGTGVWLREEETAHETIVLRSDQPRQDQPEDGAIQPSTREALVHFLRAEEAANVFHTLNSLQAARDRIKTGGRALTRDAVRDAIHTLGQQGVVDPEAERPAGKPKARSGPNTYIRVLRDLDLVESFQ